MKKIKTLTIGILIGISISLPITSFGDSALQKVEAYLNPSLPITLDGKQLELHNAPINYEGSIYLPLRETATTLGKDVKWNESTSTVELTSKINQSIPNNSQGGKKMISTTYYKEKDILKALYDKYYNSENMQLSFIKNKDVGEKRSAKYNNKEFEINSDNYYYDKGNDETYYTDAFYLQFLQPDLISKLQKYSIINAVITPLD